MSPPFPDAAAASDQPPTKPGKDADSRQRWVAVASVSLVLLMWSIPWIMSWKLTILIGAALVAGAIWLAWQEHVWLSGAEIVPGKVVELIRVKGSKGRSSYKPRVCYTTPDGTVHDFVRGYASSPAGVEMGEELAVGYRSGSLREVRIVTFGQRFGAAALLGVLGTTLMLLGAVFLTGRHYVPRTYLAHPSHVVRGW